MRPRVSLRSLLIATACAAVTALFVTRYLRRQEYFAEPPLSVRKAAMAVVGPKRIAELKLGGAAYRQKLASEHPARGLKYWSERAASIEPGMHTFALKKFLPPANWQGSWYNADGASGRDATQTIYYAVDAELAAACVVTCQKQGTFESLRVINFLGLYPHEMQLDDWGTLRVQSITYDTTARTASTADIVFESP